MRLQVTIDAKDPHQLVHFWAQALGYREEHNVRQMIAAGNIGEDDVVEVRGHLQFRDGAACTDPEGLRPRLYFQLVPEAKAAKNRLHLDLQYGREERDAQVARLEDLGASRLYEGQQGPHSWITMRDPEGNEFCVS
ncbi:MAG: VOC family protein [Ilumatobacteraceae bacterium]|nr:VOC family protein [Ilumatobacteraceae bacterium]MBL6759595.1 VOC family protein [Ilumatobacteraceae bacterium]